MRRRTAPRFSNAMSSLRALPVPAAQAQQDAKAFSRAGAVLRFLGTYYLFGLCRFLLRRCSLLRFPLLSVLLVLCYPAVAVTADETVARLGDREIGVADLFDYLARLPREERAVLNEDSVLMFRAVRSYLVRQMVLQQAQAQAFGERPEVSAELERLRDEALIELYLQSVSEPPGDYPSQADLLAAYDANSSAFLQPRQYRLAQIFIAEDEADDGASVTKVSGATRLTELLRQLEDGEENFATLAMTYSDNADEAQRGGIVGWLSEPDIVPEIRDAVAGLAEGEVSDPIRLEAGWHLVRLLETRPAGPLPLSEVADLLTERLRQERAVELRRTYLAELLRQNPIAINELALSRLIDETEE